MQQSLNNKTILITGATSGIGRACAVACAKAGAKVIITGRRAELLAEVKKEIESLSINHQPSTTQQTHPHPNPLPEGEGVKVHPLTLDVRDRKAVFDAVANLPKEFSEIDVLINNAGLALGFDPADVSSLDDWEVMIDTNIKGLLYCTKAVLPGMVARDNGHIVNMGSIAGNYPYPGGNAYGGTKAFLKQFSLNLRADLLGKQIRVTNIEPGMVETDFSLVRFHGDKSKADAVYANTEPLVADDIADNVLYAITRPRHVNINRLEVMCVMQAFNPFAIKRS